MKGWLTILMVLSHLTYTFSIEWISKFNTYVNLTTFSGFLFCFGYVCWKAYIEKERENMAKRIGKGALKSLLAFYICGIGFYANGTVQNWERVIFLQIIPGMTEFLFSFCLMYIMVLIFRKRLKKLSWGNGIVISMISLAATAVFPFESITSPVMGSVFGTTAYCSFPLMAYLVYFITGILLAKYGIIFDKWLFLLTCSSTGTFFAFCRIQGTLPRRFPPTVWWVLGGNLFVYLYYCMFKLIAWKGKSIKPFVFIGKYTLVFLVVSNLLLFAQWNQLIDEEIWEVISANRWEVRYMVCVAITFIVSWVLIEVYERIGFPKEIGTRQVL